MITEKQYNIDELSKLVDISRRTIRYYIQQDLLERPEGEKRGSYYTQEHLERLLEIKKWQKEGLSLERIKELLTVNPEIINVLPVRSQKPGDISVLSHVFIDEGIEIQIDPSKANMTSEELRSYIQKVSAMYQQVKNDRSKE